MINTNFANKLCFLSIIRHMGYRPVGEGCWSLNERIVELHDDHFTRQHTGENVSTQTESLNSTMKGNKHDQANSNK